MFSTIGKDSMRTLWFYRLLINFKVRDDYYFASLIML